MSSSEKDGRVEFEALIERWSAREGVSRSTMMGYPCLRVNTQFFACVTRDGTHLIVKLDSDDVQAAILEGHGEPFAPNGRVFKEWLAVPLSRLDTWNSFVERAYKERLP